jgi:hypothetical protein
VWWFLQATSPRRPTSYTPLREFIDRVFGITGAEQWQGTWDSDGDWNKLPAIGINATGDVVRFVGITWPDHAIRVHPLAGQAVVVGWRSPTDERLSVRLALADLDPMCGDGVRWSVNHGSHVLRSGSIPNGESHHAQTAVAPNEGDFVYLIVDAGPSGDFFCDSTGLVVSVNATHGAMVDPR